MKILVIAPHPDDETLGVGGTLLKLKEQKHSLYWLIMTKMSENLYPKQSIINREKEINKISNIYNFKKVIKLNLDTAKIDTLPLQNIIEKIFNIINEIKPDIVFTNNKSDIHTDHKIIFQAVLSAIKPFKAKYIKKVLMYETISETDVTPPFTENCFNPNVFVDISKYIETKLKIMSIYKNELMKYPLPRSLDSIKSLARYRGSQIAVEFAEAFMLIREVL